MPLAPNLSKVFLAGLNLLLRTWNLASCDGPPGDDCLDSNPRRCGLQAKEIICKMKKQIQSDGQFKLKGREESGD